MNEVFELLRTHKSIRRYTDKSVEPELLDRIIDCARQAPTSSNLQPYSIVVVRDKTKKQLLAQYCGNQVWIEQCPVFLVICPDLRRLNEVCNIRGYQFKDRHIEISIVSIVDASLVAQNIAVASESAGLGICMIGGIRNNPDKVCELLKLPQRVFPLMGICLGYPDQEPMIKPRLPHGAVVHNEEYNDENLHTYLHEYDETLRGTGLYEGAHRKLPAPDGREVPPDYSWTEHTARRAATNNPATLRVHMKTFLEERKIGLE
ncbi:MAG: NADPH-dependent oxidoreductase [bacterium]|nr:NADPH-dependent oxidoreductase [bacterium]